jgi:hypothetical protein
MDALAGSTMKKHITITILVLLACCGPTPHQSSMLEHPETTYYIGSGDFWESEEDLLYDYSDLAYSQRLTVEEMSKAITRHGKD